MKNIVLALTIMFSSAAFAEVSMLELKGIKLGDQYEAMDLSQFDCKLSLLDKDAAQCSAMDHVTLAEHKVKMRVLFFKGKVDTIAAFFPHDGFAAVKEGLLSKYGKPTSDEVRILTNGFGAEFESNEITWDYKDEFATLTERANKVDESAIHITNNASIKRYSAKKKKELSEKAKDL
jgi:hypothetical protein